ncbi:MAG: transposase, partial [bacterium]
QVSEKEFEKFFLPFLSLPKRSRKPKIPLWKIFNYILYQMDTGCQWEKIPIKLNPQTNKPEIHYTSVWKWFDRWSNDNSFERAFINSVKQLKEKNKLKIKKRIHGDGTNSLAKKGAKTLLIRAINTKKDKKQ